jgi:hypothetical protein
MYQAEALSRLVLLLKAMAVECFAYRSFAKFRPGS